MTTSDPSVLSSRVTAYADARAVLDQPLLVPEPGADAADAPAGSLAWLRATVARFTGDGQTHARRRAHAVVELARLDPRELRRAAAGSVVGADDRHTVVRILAEELGLPGPDAVADAAMSVCAGYFGSDLTPTQEKTADEAIASLLARTAQEDGVEDLEAAAQRIGLLVQACDATARLAEHARRAAPDGLPPGGADALLAEVLRQDPPVTALRRRALADVRVGALDLRSGEVVLIDVTAVEPGTPAGGDHSDPDIGAHDDPAPLAFGAGPHRCPGRAQALALAAGMLERDDPAAQVTKAVARVLDLAVTWTAWDGQPLAADDRVYTPHKAIRRVADHLVDHLAELEARLAGQEPQSDHWHASATTTPADLAPFTTEDLDEARSRLVRLGRIWADRLGALSDAQLDRSPGQGWSFRRLAAHVAGSLDYYAGAVGPLGAAANSEERV
ncbi:hypothetical protein ACFV7Q_29260 [Streptomyces sp. NPDC059851]|uniref:hypothetical protein n=1 Tax=Streptomyces sp. NPDC059851 TaxID=3346971 RepID=UPI00364F0268